MSNDVIAAAIRAEIEARSLKTAEGLEILAAQARGSIGGFFKTQLRWTDRPLETEEILDEQDTTNAQGATVRSYLVKRAVIDLDRLLDPQAARLVKRFTTSASGGISIELYDAQAAVVRLLEAAGVFKQTNLNIDISGLSETQLERIARGENPLVVLTSRYERAQDNGQE